MDKNFNDFLSQIIEKSPHDVVKISDVKLDENDINSYPVALLKLYHDWINNKD